MAMTIRPIITVFEDPKRPFDTPDSADLDDLLDALVGGVDMGIASAVIVFAESNANSSHQQAVNAYRAGDKEAAGDHLERCRLWLDIRDNARAVYVDAERVRRN